MSQFAIPEKESLAQGQLVDTFEKEDVSNDENQGRFFEVLFVPPTENKFEDTITTTFSSIGEDKSFDLEEILVSTVSVYRSMCFAGWYVDWVREIGNGFQVFR